MATTITATMKRAAVMALSLAMALLLAIPAFAQTGTYSITINNTNSGHTYTAYQIFSGDVSEVRGDETPVLSNIKWGANVNQRGIIAALRQVEPFAGLADDATAADVAEKLTNAEVLDAFLGVMGGFITGAGTSATPEGEQTSVTINLTEAGYYLVKDAVAGQTPDDFVSDYIVQVLGTETMEPKGDKPSIEKKVYEEDFSGVTSAWGDGYNDVADYDIGDAVPFKLVASIPEMAGYTDYQFSIGDTLSAGLTLDEGSIQVYVGSAKDSAYAEADALTAGADYALSMNPGDGASFTISLGNMEANAKLTGNGDNYIIVTYTATLNENAVIGLEGNPNNVDLTYSNNPNDAKSKGRTQKDYAVVFTYELDGTKVDGENPDVKLAGAEFVLLDAEGNQVAKVDADGKFDGWVNLPENTDYDGWTELSKTSNVIMASAAEGSFGVSGLDEGTYKLREIKAPEGYNLMEDMTLTVKASTDAPNHGFTGSNAASILTSLTVAVNGGGSQDGNVQDGTVSVTVENNPGTVLPETGGMGTVVFFAAGALLAIGAGILLTVRLRMKSSDDE